MRKVDYERLNRWVELGYIDMANEEPYYFMKVPDYVFVLCIDREKKIPLVKQFRLPLWTHTLELPAGLVEDQETPLETAIREAKEEVGLLEFAHSTQYGPIFVDTGRINNRTYVVVLNGCDFEKDFKPQEEISIIWFSKEELINAAKKLELEHIGHVAAVLLANHDGIL